MNPIFKTTRTTILSSCVLLVASEIEAQSYENLNSAGRQLFGYLL